MDKLVSLLIVTILSLGIGYGVKSTLEGLKSLAIERIDKGLSKSESFAQKLTGQKLKH